MSISIAGLNSLKEALNPEKKKASIRQAVSLSGQLLDQEMHQRARFNRGYSTGATQQSIHSESGDDGMSVTVYPSTEYAGYLELGTRKMSPQPFVKPALDSVAPLFKKVLLKELKS